MDNVRRIVSSLMQILEDRQKEAESLANTMHQLQNFLDEESKNIIQGGLDRLLTATREEAARLTGGRVRGWPVVVLVSPEGTVTVKEIYGDENSDPWLTRLKSEGFQVMTQKLFSSFIRSLKSEVAKGNLIPVIEFLRANVKMKISLGYPDASPGPPVEHLREPSTSSQWKLPDFLPARFPRPPLPRGLFKD
jgi:hypothetical protein